ncbi:MAG: SRPBCC domain-containing protein [Pirellulales bacterium]
MKQWNAASEDCTTAFTVDLRVGGTFSSRGWRPRMEALALTLPGLLKIIPGELIEYSFGERMAKVEFLSNANEVRVRVSFDPESTPCSLEQQREGWQAILNNFCQTRRWQKHFFPRIPKNCEGICKMTSLRSVEQ